MKRTLILFCGLLSSGCIGIFANPGYNQPYQHGTGQGYEGDVQNRYDKFQDMTYVFLSPQQISGSVFHGLSVAATFAYKGQVPRRPKGVAFSFISESSGWIYLKTDCHVLAIVDGERVDLGRAHNDTNVSSYAGVGVVTKETMTLTTPTDVFEKLARAKVVEVEISGPPSSVITAEALQKLAALAARIPPSPAQPPPAPSAQPSPESPN